MRSGDPSDWWDVVAEVATGPTLDARALAALYGVHVETIYDGAAAGTLPVAPLRVGRALRWPTRLVLAGLGIDAEHLTPRQTDEGSLQVSGGAQEPCHGDGTPRIKIV